MLTVVLLTILPASLAVSTARAGQRHRHRSRAPVSDSTERGALPPEILSELLEDYNDSLASGTRRITVPRGSMLGGKIAPTGAACTSQERSKDHSRSSTATRW